MLAIYTQRKQSMLSKLHDLPTITNDLLLYGNYNWKFEQNKVDFEAVQEYLKESGQFS